jgi:hypothetical protein
MSVLLVIAALMLAQGGKARAEEKLSLPKSSTPTPVVASMDKDGRVVLRMQVPEYRANSAIKVDPGASDTPGVYEMVWREQTYRLDVKEVKVYDTAGKEIDAKALPRLLSKETLAVYSYDPKLDPLHLRTIKDGTLIFVYLPPKPGKAPEADGNAPVPGLADFLKKQGYVAVPLERLGIESRFGVRVRVRGKELLLVVDTGAANSHFDRFRVRHLDLKSDDDGVFDLDGMEIGGLKSGRLMVYPIDMTDSNKAERILNCPLLDGLLGADVLQPLAAVMEYGGAVLYLRKQESKK